VTDRPAWTDCPEWGGYEHEWTSCPVCVAGYERSQEIEEDLREIEQERRLTILECQKVLASVLSIIVKDHGAEAVRSALVIVVGGDEYWSAIGDMRGPGGVVAEAAIAVAEDRLAAGELPPLAHPSMAVPLAIGMTIGKLLAVARAQDIREAIRWWAEPGRLETKL